MGTKKTREEIISKAQDLFEEGYACSQSILLAFSDLYGIDERTAALISSTFGGGMGRLRQKCGAVTGAFMVLGLAYGNEAPNDSESKLNSYRKVRELDKKVEDLHGSTICLELLKKQAAVPENVGPQQHKQSCLNIVGNLAGLVYDMLAEDNKLQ